MDYQAPNHGVRMASAYLATPRFHWLIKRCVCALNLLLRRSGQSTHCSPSELRSELGRGFSPGVGASGRPALMLAWHALKPFSTSAQAVAWLSFFAMQSVHAS
eukprot:scaffold37895_cov79-Phaeocystis_antarctica.AAC.6